MPVPIPLPSSSRGRHARSVSRSPSRTSSPIIGLIKPMVDAYNIVDQMPDYLPPVKYPRTPGYFPSPEENKHNAWYVKTSIKGAADGPLKGKKVAIKDNIMVAGVPMMNGCFDPRRLHAGDRRDGGAAPARRRGRDRRQDALRVLLHLRRQPHRRQRAGAQPLRMGYSAGGSSSGSGVVVALGEADMALGGDQGGSIRMPSCWCGIYGMKPTHGLVPYTGIMPIEIFVDHTGPMTKTVKDNALMLEVIAGPDGYDPRQYSPKVAEVHPDARRRREGHEDRDRQGRLRPPRVRGGGRREGHERAPSCSRRWAPRWTKSRSPCTSLGPALWMPIGVEGITQTMMFGDGYGLSRPDLYVTSLMDKLHGWQLRAQELSETTKYITTLGVYIKKYLRQPATTARR